MNQILLIVSMNDSTFEYFPVLFLRGDKEAACPTKIKYGSATDVIS